MDPCDDMMRCADGVTTNKFLDLIVKADYNSISFDIHHCNSGFAITGGYRQFGKNRFCPPIGHPSKIIGKFNFFYVG